MNKPLPPPRNRNLSSTSQVCLKRALAVPVGGVVRYPKSFVLALCLPGQTRRASTFLVWRRDKGGFQLSWAFHSSLVTIEACFSSLWRTDSLANGELKLIMTCGRSIKGAHIYRGTKRRRGPAGLYICIFYLLIVDNSMLWLLWSCYSRIKGLKCPGASPSTPNILVVIVLKKQTNITLKEFLFYFILSLFLY